MKKTIIVAIVGFLVTPLISSLIGVLLTPLSEGQKLISILGLLPIFYFFSTLATIVFGVPAFFLLRHFKLITWWAALGVGVVIGGLVSVILRLPSAPHLHDLMTMMPIGAASAFSFWLIWRLTR